MRGGRREAAKNFGGNNCSPNLIIAPRTVLHEERDCCQGVGADLIWVESVRDAPPPPLLWIYVELKGATFDDVRK